MLQFECDQAYVDSVYHFAEKMGLRKQLEKQFDWLDIYGGKKDDVRCTLYKDFAPHSFSFNIEIKRGGEFKFLYNGGLIYQGPGQPADGSAPSLTVSLHDGVGWFVHT